MNTSKGEHHHPILRAKPARTRRDSGARSQAHMELVADDIPIPPGPGWLTDAAKRMVDLFGALALIVLLLPVLIIVSIVVKLDSPGPILFKHRRLGRYGRHFDCLKFRTMCVDAEHQVFQDEQLRHHYVSNDFKIPAGLDPRITRVGRFLRQSSLDELPQLFNVLRGEMSLVGPRPIVALEATHYGDMLPVLLSVRPGITGSWATQGRSELNYPERVDVELDYVRGRTLLTDVGILARTPWTVLTRRGTT